MHQNKNEERAEKESINRVCQRSNRDDDGSDLDFFRVDHPPLFFVICSWKKNPLVSK